MNNCENHYKLSRQNAGLTQERAAELLELSVRTLSDYENGHVRPPDDTVLSMVDTYHCPLLGWWHMKQSPLGSRVLPDIQMPATNGDLALQAWSAQNSLVPAALSLMELVSGKLRPEDLCELDKAELRKKIDQLEQVRGMLVSVILYGRKIVDG